MKNRNRYSLVLELSNKALALFTSFILLSLLSTDDFGTYSYFRSVILTVGTVSLLGLSASSFRFFNITYDKKQSYLIFALAFILVTQLVLFYLLLSTSFQNILNLSSKYLYFICFSIFSNSIVLFFSATFKAIEKSLIAYFITFSQVFLFFLTVCFLARDGLNIQLILFIYTLLCCFSGVISLIFLIKKLSFHCINSLSFEPIWLTSSLKLWLSGFFPLLLLQGSLVFFGSNFGDSSIGYYSIAILIVSNLQTFKEVSISLYLPRLISQYNSRQAVNRTDFLRCLGLAAVPSLVFLTLAYFAEAHAKILLPDKFTEEFFRYLYFLLLAQICMAIFQPGFRLLSSIGFDRSVLIFSLFLAVLLVILFYVSGVLQNPLGFVLSILLVCILAVISCASLLVRFVKYG